MNKSQHSIDETYEIFERLDTAQWKKKLYDSKLSQKMLVSKSAAYVTSKTFIYHEINVYMLKYLNNHWQELFTCNVYIKKKELCTCMKFVTKNGTAISN